MVRRHVAIEDRFSLAAAPALRKLVPDGPVDGVVADVQSRHGYQTARRLQELLRKPQGRRHALLFLYRLLFATSALVRNGYRTREVAPPPICAALKNSTAAAMSSSELKKRRDEQTGQKKEGKSKCRLHE